MRHIGTLSDETQARVFGDFLFANGIKSEIESEDGCWAIWAKDEDRFPEAQAWLEKFRTEPGAAEFRTATSEAAKVRAAEAQALAAFRKRIRTRRSIWVKFGGYGFGFLTHSLIAICVIVAFYTRLKGQGELVHHLFISEVPRSMGGFLPEVLQRGEVWRLFTPMFIHFGLPHIIFNMMWLYNLGNMIEARLGWKTLLLLVFGSALISNLAQYVIVDPRFGGMSGVVYALVGFVWIRGRYDRTSGVALDQTNLVLSLGWLAFCFTGKAGPIANSAHVAGLITGMVWGRLSAHFKARNPE